MKDTYRLVIFNNETFEACDGCHAPGGFVGVDTVHKIATQNVD